MLSEATIELRLAAADASVTWTLESAQIVEGLSLLYEQTLDVVTDDAFPDSHALLGTRATLTLSRDGLVRRFHGIVQSVEDRERMRDDRWALRLVVVPELWLLSQRRDSRIFGHCDVPRIVREVLDAAGLYAGDRLELRLDDSDRAQSHPEREYCVQHQETDLAFICRLLEDEGSTFFFRHDADPGAGETLVIADADLALSDVAFRPVPTTEPTPSIALVAPGELTLYGRESVVRFDGRTSMRATSMTLSDHDFTRSARRDLSTLSSTEHEGHDLPVYDHPGPHVFREIAFTAGQPAEATALALIGALARYGASTARGGLLGGETVRLVEDVREQTLRLVPAAPLPQHEDDNGARLRRVRLDQARAGAARYRGEGNVIGFGAGSFFELVGHPRHELERAYLLLRVEHEVHAPDPLRAAEGHDPPQRYSNRFECVPRDAVWRPARATPRPRIDGTQTATVVGGPGDEIHVDPYGRVRVHFHWDRQHDARANGIVPGQLPDPALLCWVRCAQAWAGAQWGTVFIPRVGMEVVVTFLDGDPDRPLVVGCVYNDANPPPYDLPGNYHRSTIRSRSIPSALKLDGREGYNEIRFDDLAENEEIFVHAEKDLRTVVRNHHETFVGGGQDTEVRMHQTHRVQGSRVESVGGNQSETVAGEQRTTVGRGRSVDVHGTERRAAAGGRMTEARGFDTDVVRGVHLHYVAAASAPSPDTDSDVTAVYNAIGRVLDARAAGRFLDPYAGVEEPAGNPPAIATPNLPLESYVVDGNRLKRVSGVEDVWLGRRMTTVAGDDSSAVLGQYSVQAREAASMVAHGSNMQSATGLSLQSDPAELRLFHGGDGLQLTGDELRLRRRRMRLLSNDDGLEVGSETGSVRIFLGEDSTDYGMRITDDGDTVTLESKTGSKTILANDVSISAKGKLVISNEGGAKITLSSGGNVEIEANEIFLNSPSVRTK